MIVGESVCNIITTVRTNRRKHRRACVFVVVSAVAAGRKQLYLYSLYTQRYHVRWIRGKGTCNTLLLLDISVLVFTQNSRHVQRLFCKIHRNRFVSLKTDLRSEKLRGDKLYKTVHTCIVCSNLRRSRARKQRLVIKML